MATRIPFGEATEVPLPKVRAPRKLAPMTGVDVTEVMPERVDPNRLRVTDQPQVTDHYRIQGPPRPPAPIPVGEATEVHLGHERPTSFGNAASKLRPNDPAFHGTGNYGAPPNPVVEPIPDVATAARSNAASAFGDAAAAHADPSVSVKNASWLQRAKGAVGTGTTALRTGASNTARVGAQGVRAVGPAVLGAAASRLVNNAVDGDLSGPGRAPDVGPVLKPGQIPGANPQDVAPPRAPGNILRDTEAGRNIGNTLQALGPIIPAAGAAKLMGQIPLAAQRAAQVAGGFVAMPTAEAAPPGPPRPPVPNAGGGRAFVNPDAAPPVVDPNANALRTGANMTNVMPSDPNRAAIEERASATEATNSGLGKQLDAYGPGGTPGLSGMRSGIEAKNAQFDREVALGKLESTGRLARSGHERGLAMQAYAKLAAQGPNNEATQIAGINASGQRITANNALRIAELNNATQRRSNDQNNDTLRRGQDTRLQGDLAPLRYAQAMRQNQADVYKSLGTAAGKPISVEDHMKAAAIMERGGNTEGAKEAYARADRIQALAGTQDTQDRGRTEDSVKQLERYFTRMNAKGEPEVDTRAAARAHADLRRMVPDYDGLPAAQKRQVEANMIGKLQNFQSERMPAKTGLGDAALDLIGMYEQPASNDVPPDIRGAEFKRAGLFSLPGTNRNSLKATLPNGQVYRYNPDGTPMSAEQIKDLEKRGAKLPASLLRE